MRRRLPAGYTTEPGLDPESGQPVTNLRSSRTGGHIVSSHDRPGDARRAAKTLARAWKRRG